MGLYSSQYGKHFLTFNSEELVINAGEQKQMALKVNCPKINYLEHTLITLTLEAPNRGQLEIAIKSPSGNSV